MQAIREAKDALFPAAPSTGARETTGATYGLSTPTLADGLIEMAHRSLAAPSYAQRRDAYCVYLHLNSEDNSTLGSAALTRAETPAESHWYVVGFRFIPHGFSRIIHRCSPEGHLP